MKLLTEASAGTRLLSQQVSGCAYFFLDSRTSRTTRWALVFGGREICNPDFAVRRTGYDYHVLEYVADGAGRASLDGKTAGLMPGSIFAYAPDAACEIVTDPERPMLKYFLCLTGVEVGRRLARAGIALGRIRTLSTHAEVRRLFEDLIREGRHHGRQTGPLCAALLEVLLLKLAELTARPEPRGLASEELFQRCRALIDARLDQAGTIEEIAAEAGIAPSSVCRLFRRFQGVSPYQYLLRRKMTVAAECLVETGDPVKTVALKVGFVDPYHFSRCFKSVHGVAPNRLRTYRRPGSRSQNR
jgi:AraC-like DNA-binding protein